MQRRLAFGIRLWLLALVLLASAPLLALSIYSIATAVKAERTSESRQLIDKAQASAEAVAQRLNVALVLLQTLAESDAARSGQVAALYEFAQRAVALQHEASAVSLVDRQERIAFLTLRPYTGVRQPANDLASVREVFETGKPALSSAFKSPLEDRWVVALGVPVAVRGEIAYCLRLIIPVASLNAMLEDQRLPEHWYVGLLHKPSNLYLARSKEAALYVGKPPGPLLAQAIADGQTGVFASETREGQAVLATLAAVPGWRLRMVVGVPIVNLTETSRAAQRTLATFGLALLALSLLAAWWLARWISARVARVVSATAATQGTAAQPAGGPDSTLPTGIREIDLAVQRIDSLTQQRQQAHESLRQAQLDGLTQLPGRQAFLDAVEARHTLATAAARASAADRAGADAPVGRLALLFIDLDGFKRVNDTQGHDAGDRILQRTADVLRGLVRGDDLAGRLGGDEFVVCVQADAARIVAVATDVAGRIVERVRAIGADTGADIGCSIGIAIWTPDCPDLSTVLKHADEAMYAAKRAGKNRFSMG